ncbi:hypothetical protein [Rhodobium gokarnense]|uniref:Uncharacterized protein n=1 Tax=Rhodobium gokarnense TaxID=364296 RepID=A0ABT3HH50_9HYPH|nr:hypothetical protein [Rhodobium gokarnense]MCW2309727.1 hypothetical protein [Rhodobium gokarnense]
MSKHEKPGANSGALTVGELRRAIEDLPDDMPIDVMSDSGLRGDAVGASVDRLLPKYIGDKYEDQPKCLLIY